MSEYKVSKNCEKEVLFIIYLFFKFPEPKVTPHNSPELQSIEDFGIFTW